MQAHFTGMPPSLAWLPWREGNSAHDQGERSSAAVMQAGYVRGATGEWVGLLEFSQGAKLCARLLYAQ